MATSKAPEIQGPFFIGLTMNILLHGVATAQVQRVLTHFGDEANLLNGNWGHIHSGYESMPDIVMLKETSTCITIDALLTGAISGAVQHFFAWRVYVVTKNSFIVAAILLCSLANIAGSLSATITMATTSLALLPSLQIAVTTWLVGAALADMITAASLVWHLGRHKHLYPSLSSSLNRILRISSLPVEHGAQISWPIEFGHLYTNCMLFSLNARGVWKYDGTSDGDVSHRRSRSVVFQAQSMQPEVFVQVESHRMTDTGDIPLHHVFCHSGTSDHV
ncbi:hypothetical protein EDD15DRAFT_2200659 [Pisolithus albus]|nr:hypothetical protein EDD15DRAFT_2200659 [Pisolithus albus]